MSDSRVIVPNEKQRYPCRWDRSLETAFTQFNVSERPIREILATKSTKFMNHPWFSDRTEENGKDRP
jgi:hypothetical protein